MSHLKVIDLFCGGGGLSLGAALAGFESALAIDIDPKLTAMHSANFPESPLVHVDISTADPLMLLRSHGIKTTEISAILGGPPCQGFSIMGRRKPRDRRNGLIRHFFRFVKVIKPPFFMMENVPGLLEPQFKSQLLRHLEPLARNYTIHGPVVLDAGDFGAATRRRRVFVFGWLREALPVLSESHFSPQKSAATVRDAIDDLPEPPVNCVGRAMPCEGWLLLDKGSERTAYQSWLRRSPPLGIANEETRKKYDEGFVSGFQPTEHSPEIIERFGLVPGGGTDDVSRFPRLAWDAPCPTLRAGTGPERGSFQAVRPIHPSSPRVITVREAARLQGFPDWYRFPAAKWHAFRVIGNSVSPMLAETVLAKVKETFEVIREVPQTEGSVSKTVDRRKAPPAWARRRERAEPRLPLGHSHLEAGDQ